MLTVGDFDERVFLGAGAEEEIGTPRKVPAEVPAGRAAGAPLECHLQQHFDKVTRVAWASHLKGSLGFSIPECCVTH